MSPPEPVRPVRWEDAESLRLIYKPYVEGTSVTFEDRLPRLEAFRQRIDRIAGRYPWFVFEEGGDVLGYAYAAQHRERRSYRWSTEVSVYVARHHQRRGIGRFLYERLLSELRERGFFNAYAGITLPNPASEAFHESLGFARIGTYKNVGFKLGHWHDVAWWGLTLKSHEPDPAEPSVSVD